MHSDSEMKTITVPGLKVLTIQRERHTESHNGANRAPVAKTAEYRPQCLTARAGELRGGSARGTESFLEEGRLELSPEGFGKLRQEEASRSGSGEARMGEAGLRPDGCRGSRGLGNREKFLAEQ